MFLYIVPTVLVVVLSVEGYVMDQTCIELGNLIDNPSVKTLENPGVHSLHWYVEEALLHPPIL